MIDQVWQISGDMAEDTVTRLDETVSFLADREGIEPPIISAFEKEGSPLWRVDLFFAEKPDSSFLERIVKALALENWPHDAGYIEKRDWVAESQRQQPPIRAGRFFVHGAHDADKIPGGTDPIQIDAGQAFGTGRHETTWACLTVLDALSETLRPDCILDLGTGSGLLAIAAHRLWPKAHILASDIDATSIDVACENFILNRAKTRLSGERSCGIDAVVADGLEDPIFGQEGPFDLIVANILAGPLIKLSGDIARHLRTGGTLILSGLMTFQTDDVLDAYQKTGLQPVDRLVKGEWLALTLQKPAK